MYNEHIYSPRTQKRKTANNEKKTLKMQCNAIITILYSSLIKYTLYTKIHRLRLKLLYTSLITSKSDNKTSRKYHSETRTHAYEI